MERQVLKENARLKLKGVTPNPALVTLIMMFIALPFAVLIEVYKENPIIYAIAIINIFINSAINYGYQNYFLGISRGEQMTLGRLFDGFKSIDRVVGAYVFTSIITILWTLLFIIPGIIASYRYRLVPYILRDNPKMTVFEAVSQSKKMMYGRKLDLFVLDMSFLGWSLLIILTLGILALWVQPYIFTSYAEFYENILLKESPPQIDLEF